MPESSDLKKLLQEKAIWQASDKNKSFSVVSTGYSLLDQQLHYRGWPQGSLSELLLSHNGIGEIRLLSPLLKHLNQNSGYITWVNPPWLPYPAFLSAQGCQLDKMVLIRTRTLQDTVWSAQQAMASKACAAVLVWLPAKTLFTEIRKLKLATKAGNCWGFIFRDHSLEQQVSTAALRLVMQLKGNQQELKIIKQPGGWSGQQISLNLFPEQVNWNSLDVTHWPTFLAKQAPINAPSPKEDLLHLSQKPGFTKQSPSYH